MATVHVGDVGTVLELTVTENGVAIDLSPAITKWIKFQRKDRTTFAVEAAFKTDGIDGILQYTFQEGELNQKGTWTVQGYVVMPNGKWHTTETTFEVEDVISVASENAPQ